ncbi:hypothetical protein IEQ34_013607 [Dendrobium chrysotoxum]|uniref:Uncharacterized protein n=1 Tax=Dendrobium chrysotoxum TaxID=161865 RepID=A0AAV7GPN3_DENCH|nr:hypothetical protein IEQ34_013607 [Dendrobium chrysotoxum]
MVLHDDAVVVGEAHLNREDILVTTAIYLQAVALLASPACGNKEDDKLHSNRTNQPRSPSSAFDKFAHVRCVSQPCQTCIYVRHLFDIAFLMKVSRCIIGDNTSSKLVQIDKLYVLLDLTPNIERSASCVEQPNCYHKSKVQMILNNVCESILYLALSSTKVSFGLGYLSTIISLGGVAFNAPKCLTYSIECIKMFGTF